MSALQLGRTFIVDMQLFSLQAALSNIIQSPVRIEHRTSENTYLLCASTGTSAQEIENRKVQISQLLKKHKLADTSFEIEEVSTNI